MAPRIGRYPNPSAAQSWLPDGLPPDARAEPLLLPTPDRSATSGTLYQPAGRAAALVAVMHPRVDCTHHPLIPALLRAGYAVWAQRSRNVGNDLSLVHEQVLVDIATAHAHLAERGFEEVYLLGNSGGASLYCFYVQQASRPPEQRLKDDPSGARVDLTVDMPMPEGLILLAPHPGQGDLLLRCIDPSVTDESDGASVDPTLDMYDPRNGFREPPEPSSYSREFVEGYRAAQRERVARIDRRAREILAESSGLRRKAREDGDAATLRSALVPRFMTVYRTDADPRTTDPALDPSGRDYGSIFGVRPDIINYGPVGFGRLATPRAWLSTWSGLSSRAAIRLTGPEVEVPTLTISHAADNSVFPKDVEEIREAINSPDKTFVEVEGDHYGYDPRQARRPGIARAAEEIVSWLARQRRTPTGGP